MSSGYVHTESLFTLSVKPHPVVLTNQTHAGSLVRVKIVLI